MFRLNDLLAVHAAVACFRSPEMNDAPTVMRQRHVFELHASSQLGHREKVERYLVSLMSPADGFHCFKESHPIASENLADSFFRVPLPDQRGGDIRVFGRIKVLEIATASTLIKAHGDVIFAHEIDYVVHLRNPFVEGRPGGLTWHLFCPGLSIPLSPSLGDRRVEVTVVSANPSLGLDITSG